MVVVGSVGCGSVGGGCGECGWLICIHFASSGYVHHQADTPIDLPYVAVVTL